jgi:colicin import membrane protein
MTIHHEPISALADDTTAVIAAHDEAPILAPDDDPFVYGWRYVWCEELDDYDQIPLTLDDVLHPEEGDELVLSSLHEEFCLYLFGILLDYYKHDPSVLVLHDTGIYWDIPELRHHSPDLAVIFGIQNPREDWRSFHVAREGGVRPVLIAEVTSPHTRIVDVDSDIRPRNKYRQYRRAGVPYYIIIDNARRAVGHPPPLFGYRLNTAGAYEPLQPNARGWLWLEPLQLWLGTSDYSIALYDRNGKMLGDYTSVKEELAAASVARMQAETARARAEAEAREATARVRELEAELRRLRGEE